MTYLDKIMTGFYVADFARYADVSEFRSEAAKAYRDLDPTQCTYDEYLDRLTDEVRARH